MTEDDTFRKLKQAPFESVRQTIATAGNASFVWKAADWHEMVLKVLSTNGWTEDEYKKEFMKREA
jgi:hypothetical protein